MFKKFSYCAIVAILASMAMAQTAHATFSEDEVGSKKCLSSQKPKLTDHKDIKRQYEDLFLDPWEKLIREGRNADARQFAFQRENQKNNPGNNFSINNPWWDEEYNALRNRKWWRDNDYYREGFFRTYDTQPEKLIEKHKKRIADLEKAVEDRYKLLEDLAFDPREHLSHDYVEEQLPAFLKDTEEKIAFEKKRIAFIEQYPEFFQVLHRSRAEILGIEKTHEFLSPMPSGTGVIVGVIDMFEPCQQNSRILHQAVNPDFKGIVNFRSLTSDEKNHGIHVAGIIVSTLFDQIDFPMTQGVTPDTQFEMMDHQSLESNYRTVGAGRGLNQEPWTVEEMAMKITELSDTGKTEIHSGLQVHELDLSLEDLLMNPIVASKAQILNLSMTFSSLKAFKRQHIATFESVERLPVLIKSLKTKLLVIAAGNDGISLSDTDQHRIPKALAHSTATAKNMLLVTNLMQDGLTLYHSANTPGKDPLVKARTVCAPGTQVKSTLLMETPESAAYGEMTGTSMATPHVSGIGAIVLSNHPHLENHEIADCLLKGAIPLLYDENSSCAYELTNFTAASLNASLVATYPQVIEIPRGQFISSSPATTPDYLEVTTEWWEKSQELYGQGRVNLQNALSYAKDM